MEKVINQQLSKHLEHHRLLDSSQSSFRSNHSTEAVLTAATDNIQALLDKGETAALILLDLSAAFDTISHHTLITRLHDIGIQGTELN